MKERGIIFSGDMVRAILDGRKTQTRRAVTPQPPNETTLVSQSCKPGWFAYKEWETRKGDECLTLAALGDCPYGVPGDRLWVRETWWSIVEEIERAKGGYETWHKLRYDADGLVEYWPYSIHTDFKYPSAHLLIDCPGDDAYAEKKRPSIHMPRWASRITLEITDVRVERVQEITPSDTLAEGIDLPVPANCSTPSQRPDGWDGWSDAKKDEWISGQARVMYFSRCADVEDHVVAFHKLWDSLNVKRGYGWEANPWVWALTFKRLNAT